MNLTERKHCITEETITPPVLKRISKLPVLGGGGAFYCYHPRKILILATQTGRSEELSVSNDNNKILYPTKLQVSQKQTIQN